MQNRYGFKEVMNMYQSTDNIRYPQEDIEDMIKVLTLLPKQNKGEIFEIIFFHDSLMVTEGDIDKSSGKGTVFGFNSKTKNWEELNVAVANSDFIRAFSYGNIVINEDGIPISASVYPFKEGVQK